MGTLQSFRKAYGALKDQTKVGLAHVNSDFKDVDVAIVKATNHVERPPKERHLRKIFAATSAVRPRADVAYCIHALTRRLTKTRNWTVALKTLIVIHRALREGDPTFREELLNFQQRGHILQLSNFKDDSSPIAWDCSGWVRTYSLFLEERIECFRILKYDIEAERLPKSGQAQEKGYSRTRELGSDDMLDQLPALQQLLYRLIGSRPEGAAVHNYVIQYALALVLKESFKIYCAINDGIINLVDKFFEMPRHEAMKALDIYKRAGQQAGSLSEFYEVCKGLELARNFQFPFLREPPQSFLATMEEYIREAPSMVSAPRETLVNHVFLHRDSMFQQAIFVILDMFRNGRHASLVGCVSHLWISPAFASAMQKFGMKEYPERLLLTYKPEEAPAEETEVFDDDFKPLPPDDVAILDEQVPTPASAPAPAPSPPPIHLDTGDLLGLSVKNPDASLIEESNALALAIVPSGTASSTDSGAFQAKDFDPTGWELALVSTPSTNLSSVNDRQLAGGMDSLTLNSLYDEGAYRASQQPSYGTPAPNPFEAHDPFSFSNIAPHSSVQMATIGQQQQTNPFGSYQPTYIQSQQPNLMMGGQQNPFGDTGFTSFPSNHVVHPQTNNPFGSTGLL